MAETFEVCGHVKEWSPSDGRKPGKALIGGRWITVWATEKLNGEKVGSLAYRSIKEAAENAHGLKAKGDVSKDGNFTNYTVREVTTATEAEIQAGDALSEAKGKGGQRGGGKSSYVPRDETWQAARWAISTAMEITLAHQGNALLGDAKVRDEVEAQARWLLGFSQDLRDEAKKADTPATSGDGTESSEKPSEDKLPVVF